MTRAQKAWRLDVGLSKMIAAVVRFQPTELPRERFHQDLSHPFLADSATCDFGKSTDDLILFPPLSRNGFVIIPMTISIFNACLCFAELPIR